MTRTFFFSFVIVFFSLVLLCWLLIEVEWKGWEQTLVSCSWFKRELTLLLSSHCGTPTQLSRNSTGYPKDLPHPGSVPLPLPVLSLVLRSPICQNALGMGVRALEGQIQVAFDIPNPPEQPQRNSSFHICSPFAYFVGTPLHPSHFSVSGCWIRWQGMWLYVLSIPLPPSFLFLSPRRNDNCQRQWKTTKRQNNIFLHAP